MKQFKKIPIKGLRHLEINEDGYILDPKTGNIEYMEDNEFLLVDNNNDNNIPKNLIIEITFKDEK